MDFSILFQIFCPGLKAPTFSLNWKLWFFEPNLSKKSQHHHWILHIRISLDTKFYFKQKTLNFGTKFVQKGYFRLKTQKVNIIMELCMFELLYYNFDLLDQICPNRIFPV